MDYRLSSISFDRVANFCAYIPWGMGWSFSISNHSTGCSL